MASRLNRETEQGQSEEAHGASDKAQTFSAWERLLNQLQGQILVRNVAYRGPRTLEEVNPWRR